MKYGKPILDAICEDISKGVPVLTAIACHGMPTSCYYDYKTRADGLKGKPETEYTEEEKILSEFSEGIKKAEGQAIALRVKRIEGAGQAGNWQADAWFLERRYPKEYGRHDRVDNNVKVEKEIDADKLTDEELRELKRLQDKATPG